MEIQNQVITREQAESLVALGITANSKFLHVLMNNKHGQSWYLAIALKYDNFCILSSMVGEKNKIYEFEQAIKTLPAYTASEIGVALVPYMRKYGKPNTFPRPNLDDSQWNLIQGYNDGDSRIGDTEVKARATMLIYMLKENRISPEAVNFQISLS